MALGTERRGGLTVDAVERLTRMGSWADASLSMHDGLIAARTIADEGAARPVPPLAIEQRARGDDDHANQNADPEAHRGEQLRGCSGQLLEDRAASRRQDIILSLIRARKAPQRRSGCPTSTPSQNFRMCCSGFVRGSPQSAVILHLPGRWQ
jgi:hypothetical protein